MRNKAPLALALLVAFVAVSPLFASRAEAHAALVRANPSNNETLTRPPTRVILGFSEPIERRLTKIEVFDREDERVDEGDIAFDDNDPAFASVGVTSLDPGLYFVRWSNVSSVDGHQLKGSYPFIVLKPDGSFPAGVTLDTATGETSGTDLLPKNIDAALKWIALLSLAVVAGAAFFLAVVLRPAGAFLEEAQAARAGEAGERWLANIAHVLLPASFMASAFLVIVTVSRFETDTGIWSYLTDVRAGQYRAALLVLLVLALAATDLIFLSGSRTKRNIGLGVLMATCAGALLTFPLVSHSATSTGKFWSVLSDYAHLLASSAWLGALVMLPPLMRWLRNEFEETERFLFMANVFDRFSIVAGLSVIVVLATGVFNGLVELPDWQAFVDTTYGRVLLAKLALIVPLLAIAGVNAFVLKPRLVSAIDATYQRDAASAADAQTASKSLASLRKLLPRTIVVEVALIVAVFAAVAILTQTSTARGEIAQEQAERASASKFSQSAEASGLKLTLEVNPNRVGINEYSLLVQTPEGQPVETVTQARLRFAYEDIPDAVAPSELILNRFGPGDYRGAGAYFTQPGNWRTTASVRRSDGDDVSQAFVLPVLRPEASTSTQTGGAFDLPFTSLTWNEVAGAALVLAGVVVVIYRRQLRWIGANAQRVGMTVAVLLIMGGGVLAFGVDEHTTAINARDGNPVAPTTESVAAGRELFQNNCITCHGIDGRGDGPAAAQLNPAPTDFRLHMPLHTDPQFYKFIADGYPGSAMPAFRENFSDEEIWNLVNFLRASFTEEPSE